MSGSSMLEPYRRPGATTRAARAVLAAAIAGVVLVGCQPEDDPAETTVPVTGELATLDAPPDLTSLVPEDRRVVPVELIREDLIEGEGRPAAVGDRITAHVGVMTFTDARVVSASWDGGQPLTVGLGTGTVIEGLEQGLSDMRVGGRRLLTVPAELAYGERGVGDVIGPGEPLVLLVDLLLIEPDVADVRP